MLKFAPKISVYFVCGVLFCFAINIVSAQPPKKVPAQTIKQAGETPEKLFEDAQKLIETGLEPNLKAAISKLLEAAALFRSQNKNEQLAACFNYAGNASSTLSDQKSAIDYYTRSLKIYEQLQNSDGIALLLNNLGWSWLLAGDFKQSLDSYGRGLAVAEKAESPARQSLILYNTGYTYAMMGDKDEAVNFYKRALETAHKNSDSAFEFQVLSALGTLYVNYADRRQGVEYLEKARQMPPELSTAGQKFALLNNLALAYDGLGEKQLAINYYQQSLDILKTSPDPAESITLNNIGLIYLSLSNFDKAVENFEKALGIAEKNGDKLTESKVLNNLAYLYDNAGKYDKAATYYGKSFEIAKQIKDWNLIVKILNNLSVIFIKLDDPNESLNVLNTALPLVEKLQDRELEATVNNNFARTYGMLGDPAKAVQYYTKSLGIAHANGYKSLEAVALTNLMVQWDKQKNPNLAVFYGKQAVNLYQQLRTDIKNFDDASRKSYLDSVSEIYRKLADILIDLGRLPEAQAILGMLKEEEYLDFVQRDEGEAKKLLGSVELSPQESEAVARYEKIANEITTKAAEYEKLKRQRPANDEEKAALDKRKTELNADLTAASQTFNLVLKQIETEFAKTKPAADITATMNENRGLQADLARWKIPNTVILSTIVGEENYSVILTTPSVQVVGQTPIKSAELNKMVHDFREAVQNPCACVDPRPLGEKLYNVLLKPIAPQLAELEKQANGKPLTLVWSLDGTLRYLPISALWDGKKYLAEKYLNVEFSLASRTRLGENPSAEWHGLGVGVTQAHGDFVALPSVKDELLNGAIHDEKTPGSKGIVPGRVFLDTQFTESTFAQELSSGEYPLVHIASHFAFKPGNEKQSYLLLGDGSELSLDKIRQSPDFKFNGVELLTLSACNTATGEAGADGKEFESFAVLAQQNGAMAVLATLWSVADESTQNLMNEFYRGHQENHLSKAEALRNAQLALLNGTLKSNLTQTRRSDLAGETNGNAANLPPFTKDVNKPFAHPYYWSPFVLIGNWR